MTPDDVIARLVDRVADLQRQINELKRAESPAFSTLFKIRGRQGGSGSFWTAAGTNNYTLTQQTDLYFGAGQVTVNAGTKTGNVTITLPASHINSAFLAAACLRGGGNIDAEINTRELTANTFGVYVTLQANVGANTNFAFTWWAFMQLV